MADAPAINPLLLSARDAARLCGVSVKTWRRWDSAGRVPIPIRIGGAVRWRADELHQWINAGCPGRREWLAIRN